MSFEEFLKFNKTNSSGWGALSIPVPGFVDSSEYNPALQGFNPNGANLAPLASDAVSLGKNYSRVNDLGNIAREHKWKTAGILTLAAALVVGLVTRKAPKVKTITKIIEKGGDDAIAAAKAAGKNADEAADVVTAASKKTKKPTRRQIRKQQKAETREKLQEAVQRNVDESILAYEKNGPKKTGFLGKLKKKINNTVSKKANKQFEAKNYNKVEPTVVEKTAKKAEQHSKIENTTFYDKPKTKGKVKNSSEAEYIAKKRDLEKGAAKSSKRKLSLKDKAKLKWANVKDKFMPGHKGSMSNKEIDAINNQNKYR